MCLIFFHLSSDNCNENLCLLTTFIGINFIMDPNILDIYLDMKGRRYCLSGEDKSADVMNEGFHEGLDSGQMYQN